MRGRTFKNSFIIADEMQNSSPNQMKMLTTRIGVNSKMVITGDLNQSDIPSKNGLKDLIEKIDNYNIKNNREITSIKVVKLEKEDIERSEIVKNIINIYDYNDKNVSVNNKTTNVTAITMADISNITNKDVIASTTNTSTIVSKNNSNNSKISSSPIKNIKSMLMDSMITISQNDLQNIEEQASDLNEIDQLNTADFQLLGENIYHTNISFLFNLYLINALHLVYKCKNFVY
jgi:hypothetical protein